MEFWSVATLFKEPMDLFAVASDKFDNNLFAYTGFIQNLPEAGYTSRTVLERI